MDDLISLMVQDVLDETSPEALRRRRQAITDLDREIADRRHEARSLEAEITALDEWVRNGSDGSEVLLALVRRRIETLRRSVESVGVEKLEARRAALQHGLQELELDHLLVMRYVKEARNGDG